MRPVVRRETNQQLRDRKAEQLAAIGATTEQILWTRLSASIAFRSCAHALSNARQPVCADRVNVAVPEAAIRRDVLAAFHSATGCTGSK